MPVPHLCSIPCPTHTALPFPLCPCPAVVGLPTPIPVPNLQRLYFKFAPPVDPQALGTDIRNAQQVCIATGQLHMCTDLTHNGCSVRRVQGPTVVPVKGFSFRVPGELGRA